MAGLIHSSLFGLFVLILAASGVFGHYFDVISKTSDPAPLVLTVTPAHYTTGITGYVSLECHIDLHYGSDVETLYWMRILKRTHGGWSLVAQLRDLTGAENKTDHVTAVGQVGSSVGEAHLMIKWPADDHDVFGEYICDALGTDPHLQFVVEKSSILSIREQNITAQDLLELMHKRHAELRKDTEDLADDVEDNSLQMNDLLARILKLEREMKEHLHEDDASHQNITSVWPAGNVGLLMPQCGCPTDPAFHQDNSSYVKFHVESPTNRSCGSHQPNFHLSQPLATETGSECYMNLRFCEAANVSSNISWPEGSYCLNWDTHDLCPPSFEAGRVVLDQVDGTDSHVVSSSVVELSGTYTYLHFCCKNTRPYDIPMVLPTESPFYLYRYNGFCQEVLGMRVEREYIDIDTEDVQNGDAGHGVHPDIVIQKGQPTRIEICYYTKES
ncbi:apextrin [Elysia marginata]|uniref:Apextrin n=1 Tax=Elysia marginata TaxID=1093978 RepID=A0AAV4IGH7_9GAST|nr:apextrin [Elysia marginata]